MSSQVAAKVVTKAFNRIWTLGSMSYSANTPWFEQEKDLKYNSIADVYFPTGKFLPESLLRVWDRSCRKAALTALVLGFACLPLRAQPW